MLVSRLENRPEIETALTASFEKLLARYRAMTVGRTADTKIRVATAKSGH